MAVERKRRPISKGQNQRGLVGEEMIKPAIEPIFGDLLIAELQQIARRRAAALSFLAFPADERAEERTSTIVFNVEADRLLPAPRKSDGPNVFKTSCAAIRYEVTSLGILPSGVLEKFSCAIVSLSRASRRMRAHSLANAANFSG
jgi:hypothetical protein